MKTYQLFPIAAALAAVGLAAAIATHSEEPSARIVRLEPVTIVGSRGRDAALARRQAPVRSSLALGAQPKGRT